MVGSDGDRVIHAGASLSEDEVRRRTTDSHWSGTTTPTFWLRSGGARVGLLRLEDVGEGTPLSDLRVDAAHRGQGLGTAAVRWQD